MRATYREQEMNYVMALMLAAAFVMVTCGGSSDPDCDGLYRSVDGCYGVDKYNVVYAACTAERTYGLCTRNLYWACYTDNECSGTNDTDTIAKIEACLVANAACQ